MKGASTSKARMGDIFSQIEQIPPTRRMVIVSFVMILVAGAFIWFLYLPKNQSIDQLEKDLSAKQGQLTVLKTKARQLDQFREEMRQTDDRFKIALEALPEKDEIPALLAGISRSGHEVGMEFLLFEPKGEQFKEFYAEIPVLVRVTGGYHQVGRFFEMVAKLPRIVNLRDIAMTFPKEGEPLTTSCTAVTYKFVEPPPGQPGEGAKKGGLAEKLKKAKEDKNLNEKK